MSTEQIPTVKESLQVENTTFNLEWAKRGGVVYIYDEFGSEHFYKFHSLGRFIGAKDYNIIMFVDKDDCVELTRMATRAECDAAGVEYIEPPSDVDALRKRVEALDASESQLIIERDIAEKAIDDVMNIVFGANAQEWSSEYGFGDALEDIATEFHQLETRIRSLEESIESTKTPFCKMLDFHFDNEHFQQDANVFIELQRKLYSVKGGA